MLQVPLPQFPHTAHEAAAVSDVHDGAVVVAAHAVVGKYVPDAQFVGELVEQAAADPE